jgi:hypothetical protein
MLLGKRVDRASLASPKSKKWAISGTLLPAVYDCGSEIFHPEGDFSYSFGNAFRDGLSATIAKEV